jgi:hypothetical protein
LARLLWGGSEIDGCQGMEGESRRQICIGYHSKGGTGYTVRAICQWRRRELLSCNPYTEIVKQTRNTFLKTIIIAHVSA